MRRSERAGNQLGRAIAIVGGGALVVWLLCRGRRGGRSDGASDGAVDDRGTPATTSGGRVGLPVPTSGGHAGLPAPTSVHVIVLPGDRVQVDGVDTDLQTLFVRARAVRRALVDMRPGVREAWATRVVEQLRGAGVDVQFG